MNWRLGKGRSLSHCPGFYSLDYILDGVNSLYLCLGNYIVQSTDYLCPEKPIYKSYVLCSGARFTEDIWPDSRFRINDFGTFAIMANTCQYSGS